jgi:hypothetical protein
MKSRILNTSIDQIPYIITAYLLIALSATGLSQDKLNCNAERMNTELTATNERTLT